MHRLRLHRSGWDLLGYTCDTMRLVAQRSSTLWSTTVKFGFEACIAPLFGERILSCKAAVMHTTHEMSQQQQSQCRRSQVLDFSRSVLEDLSNFDVSGAWPVLLDEFVESLQVRGAQHAATGESSLQVDKPPGRAANQGVDGPDTSSRDHLTSLIHCAGASSKAVWAKLPLGSPAHTLDTAVARQQRRPRQRRSFSCWSVTRGGQARWRLSLSHDLRKRCGSRVIPPCIVRANLVCKPTAVWRSKRRAPDVDSITSRLEAARLANLSSPHTSPLGASSVQSAEQLAQPLKRLHVLSSAS